LSTHVSTIKYYWSQSSIEIIDIFLYFVFCILQMFAERVEMITISISIPMGSFSLFRFKYY
jgi:hypothetical protein